MKNGMPSRLEKWLHVADTNGGLDVSQIAPTDADELLTILFSTAAQEVQRLMNAAENTVDDSYRISLQKLLALKQKQKLDE